MRLDWNIKTEQCDISLILESRHGGCRPSNCESFVILLIFIHLQLAGPGEVTCLLFFICLFSEFSSRIGEDLVYVQFFNAHSAMIPNKLSRSSTIVDTFEQVTLCKYKGRPHWGKNHERTVRHPDCKVRDLYPAANTAELLDLQHLHDPRKVFEPELFSDVMQRKGPDYSPLCSPHFWCYCAADSYCPSGYECRSSPTFPEYKICKPALLHDEL